MSILFNFINAIMSELYSFVGDWGIAIVLVTLLIRLCLLPLSLKQRKSMSRQQMFSGKIEEIKRKYANDKEKQQEEIAKLSSESMKVMVGCLITILQIPIMYTLYRVFSEMPTQVGSVIVPWISNIKLPDAYHIIPLIAVLIQLLPNIITTYAPVKNAKENSLRWPQLLIMGGFSMIFFIKAPVTLGIYWVTTGLFSTLEQVLYNRFGKTAVSSEA